MSSGSATRPIIPGGTAPGAAIAAAMQHVGGMGQHQPVPAAVVIPPAHGPMGTSRTGLSVRPQLLMADAHGMDQVAMGGGVPELLASDATRGGADRPSRVSSAGPMVSLSSGGAGAVATAQAVHVLGGGGSRSGPGPGSGMETHGKASGGGQGSSDRVERSTRAASAGLEKSARISAALAGEGGDGGDDGAAMVVGAAAAAPAARKVVRTSPVLIMEELLDKLKCMDYEWQFCRKHNRPHLTPTFFADPLGPTTSTRSAHGGPAFTGGPAAQFDYFIALAVWLIEANGVEAPDVDVDSHSALTNVLATVTRMGWVIDVPASRFRSGHGFEVRMSKRRSAFLSGSRIFVSLLNISVFHHEMCVCVSCSPVCAHCFRYLGVSRYVFC